MKNKLDKGYSIVIEDIIDNVFITLALSFLIDHKSPTINKTFIIICVTIFYWFIVYRFTRPLYLCNC